MSNLKHIGTATGIMSEIRNVQNDQGNPRSILVWRKTKILRPLKIDSELTVKLSIH